MGGDDHGDEHSGGLSLQGFKILSIFIVLITSYLGAVAPYLIAWLSSSKDDSAEERKKKHRRVQIVMKLLTCISIGVIISVVLTHLLPHGVTELSESGNSLFAENHGDEHHEEEHDGHNETNHSGEDDHDDHDDHAHAYPFAYLFAMCAFFSVFFISTEINWYGVKKLKEAKGVACDEKEESRISALIKLWTAVIGIAVHSVIIGLALGVVDEMSEARTLLIVLVFHNFFEGLSIGVLTATGALSALYAFFFHFLFAVTTPIGIGIGIGVEEKTNAVARGVVLCLAAGALMYTGCVELLPHLMGSHAHHAHGPLPLAELHNHVHHHHDDENEHEGEKTVNEVSSNNNEDNAANNTNPLATSAAEGENDKELTQVPATGSPVHPNHNDNNNDTTTVAVEDTTSNSSADHYHDHHEEDESFVFRLACYACLIFGASVQSVLAIWA